VAFGASARHRRHRLLEWLVLKGRGVAVHNDASTVHNDASTVHNDSGAVHNGEGAEGAEG